MILAIDDTLKAIGDFVNSCLAFLGVDFQSITPADWAKWGIDFSIQLIATIVLFLLVKFKLWKPITELVEKRKNVMDSKLIEAEEAEAKANEIKLQNEKELADTQIKIKQMIADAERDSNLRKEEIIEEAKKEAQRRLDNANQQIELDVKNKEQEIKNLIINTAFEAASKIIEKEVDREKYIDLVNQIIVRMVDDGK